MVKRSVWDQVQEEYGCDHEEHIEVRKMTMSDGRPLFVRQCTRCGHSCGNVKKDSLTGIQRLKMVAFDEELRQGWQKSMTDRAEELRREDSEHWWRQYNAYLETPEWKARRKAVLERDEFLCQGCRKNRATQAHHLTYVRKGNEMLFDLVAVCDECHAAIHPTEADNAD